MKKLKVIICKAGNGFSAHLPAVDGYVIVRSSIKKIKEDIRSGLQFHIEGLYAEERQDWMSGGYDFEFAFGDLASLLDAYADCFNHSSLARITGINEEQMRQYAAGVKQPSPKTLQRIASGVQNYARKLQEAAFA